MDKNRFDGFTRQLAKRENRRTAIKTLFAGGVGTAATVLVGGETDAAKTDCCPADHPTLCGLTCTDTITSVTDCGGCGNSCGANERCYKSACESTSVNHCAVATDCPGADTECSTRTCKKSICGVTYAASGKKVTSQIPGDCQRNVCDGAGNVISIVDNTDKPAATGECTTGICANGVPQQNALPSGRKCTNGKCDGAGHCSGSTGGCTSSTTCPGTDTECATRTCTNGVCGTSFTPNGTATASQTTGDCQVNVCDGNGGVTSIPDDTDFTPPYYDQPCIGSVCNAGVPSNPPLAAGTPCIGGSGVCDGSGVCVDCLTNAHCSDSGVPNTVTICSNGHCVYQCIPGYSECIPNGGGCVDTNIDPSHCGACGHVCSAQNGNVICANGACALIGCSSGFDNCNGDPADGCETDITSDPANCGVCGNVCASGSCQDSACV